MTGIDIMTYRIISKMLDYERKCGGCNWETTVLYCYEGQDVDDIGMCASCFLDYLVEINAEVIKGEAD